MASQAPRRVSSALLAALTHSTHSSNSDSTPPVDTLFVHPNVKIVQFTTSGKALLPDVDAARQEAGTLPPWSRLERTIAVGRYP